MSPGEQRVLDLYFPVPGNLDSASEIPTFDVTWKIQTADRVVAMRTPFERRDVVSPPAYPDVYTIGWGPHWWYHDGYGYGRTYVHRPRVIVRPHGRVIVHDHSRR